MNHLATLGLAPKPQPAPSVALPPARLRRVNIQHIPRRPSEHPDPTIQHRAAGLITALSAGTVMVDHAARALSEMALFNYGAKHTLNQLKALSDKLLGAMMDKFDCEDGDAANLVSDALGLVAEKFCQLSPAQMDAALRHMDEMVRANVVYVPVPTPLSTTLKDE